MKVTRETYPVNTPCAICGGTITLTLEYKRHILFRGWAAYAECVNHCNLQRISGDCFQEWADWVSLSDKKAVLEQHLKQYENVANSINLARQKCESCGKLPRLAVVSNDPRYMFLCDCPSLRPAYSTPTIGRAAWERTWLIEEEAKLQAEKQTVNQFNHWSEELS